MASRGPEQVVFRLPPPEPETDSSERNRKAAKRATREESRFHSGMTTRLLGRQCKCSYLQIGWLVAAIIKHPVLDIDCHSPARTNLAYEHLD